jgi:hypothetical protein
MADALGGFWRGGLRSYSRSQRHSRP